MSIWTRIFGGKAETRAADPSWNALRTGGDVMSDAGVPVSPYLAENLSVVFACVQIIAETVGMLPLVLYRKQGDGVRQAEPSHPVARLFTGNPNEWQTASEFIELMTAHCLLRGWAPAEIIRDGRGAPVELRPHHPDWVSLVKITSTGRYAYDISLPAGGTRRLLPEEMFILRDRTDDGITPKSRLQRAREVFGSALATERYANATFKNGASMSGIISYDKPLTETAQKRLRADFDQKFKGADAAGKVAIFEDGLRWTQVSVSPDEAQMLESRKFSTAALARVYRVPPPVLGDFEGGNYSSISEVGRWFHSHCIQPWLNRWERAIERALLSEEGRRSFEVEFDADLLMRTNMLERLQSYRIGREVGLYSANDLRRFEHLNPRTDVDADTFLSPLNMASEQTARPRGDRGGDE
jgi:HK97 family phage portal protein